MKLSELIDFRNRLEELPVSIAERVAQDKLDILMNTVNQPHRQSMVQLTQPFIPELETSLKEIHSAFNNFSTRFEQLKQHVRDQIEEQEKYWFQESYRLFEEAEECEKNDRILYSRQIIGTKSEQTLEAEDTLRARLSNYADWRWPGMIIRPGLENYVENMVGCDPLYIVDRDHDLLRPCLDRFPTLYQNRLRSYTTNDWNDQPILDKIPSNQFGICLACNVFNYRPLGIIRRYLEEIYTKLRPGGVLLMTYNDCDRSHAVMLVEQFCASYTPGYLVRELTQSIGFELIHTWSDGGPSVWLELRKPGQLLSNRGGQSLAKIHNIFDYSDDVDFLRRKAYTNDELINLHNRARALDISKKIIKRSYTYELETLVIEKEYIKHRQQEEEEFRIRMEQERIDAKNRIEKERIDRELHEARAKELDQQKKEELVKLRQRAMELQAGNPNLIRYGYSAEKLKTLIKQKEEENR
jgi:SAM-dependent methyltransferase